MTENLTTRSRKTMHAWWMGAAVASLLWVGVADLRAQEGTVAESRVSLAAGSASLELELAGGDTRVITLSEGIVSIDGEARGSYEPGGSLESSWRSLLTSPELFKGSGLAERLAAWVPDAGGSAEEAAGGALEAVFDRLAGGANRTTAADAVDVAEPGGAGTVALGGERVRIAPGEIGSLAELTRGVETLRAQLEVLGGQLQGLEEGLALVVHDDYVVGADQQVAGNLALLSGDLQLDGAVAGDVLVLDGTLTLGPSARVDGDVLQVGGDVVDAGGRIAGEMVSLVSGALEGLAPVRGAPSSVEAIDIPVPVRVDVRQPGFFGSIGRNIERAFTGLLSAVAWFLALAALGFVVVYFFRSRLETVAGVVRADTARAFGVGLAGQLLVLPITLVLIVGIVTWLVIPVYALAVALAIPAGYLAVAHAVGEAVQEQRFEWARRFRLDRTSSYHHVFSGLLFLLAPFAIGSALYLLGGILGFVRGLMFFAATLLTWAAVTTGFGAIILTRAGGRRARRSQADYDDLFSAADLFDSEDEGEAARA